MGIVQELGRCGLDLTAASGATVEVGGRRATVTAVDADQYLELSASLPLEHRPDPALLDSVGLASPGDSTLDWSDGVLRAGRRLLAPSLGAAYDAVFELAKAAVVVARAVDRRDDSGPAEAPPAEPTQGVLRVETATPVFDSERNVVANLQPGRPYPILAEAQGWVRTRTAEGLEGWVAADRVTAGAPS